MNYLAFIFIFVSGIFTDFLFKYTEAFPGDGSGTEERDPRSSRKRRETRELRVQPGGEDSGTSHWINTVLL